MRFFVLAVSYKYRGFCVAGINFDTLEFVRLGKAVPASCECASLSIGEITVNGQVLSVGDLIEVEAVKLPVNGCQTENYELIRIIGRINKLSPDEIEGVYCKLYHPDFIFKDTSRYLTREEISDVHTSVGFFKVQGLIIHRSEKKTRANFRYNGQTYRDIAVTDCRICGYPAQFGSAPVLGTFREAYIAVTLPNDDWAEENGFYKYVSGVII